MGQPTPCTVPLSLAIRRGDTTSCQVLSCPVTTVGGDASLGDAKPPGFDIWWSISCVGTCSTESYLELIIFYRGTLILCQSHRSV
jgi:hypothetical protein